MALDALRVEEAGLRQELWKSVAARKGEQGADAADVKKRIVRAETQAPTVAEQRLLELLVHDEELRRQFLPNVSEEDFEDLPTASVFRALKELDAQGRPVDFSTLDRKSTRLNSS